MDVVYHGIVISVVVYITVYVSVSCRCWQWLWLGVDVVGCVVLVSIVVTADVDDIIFDIVCCVVVVHAVVGCLLVWCRCRCMPLECMLYSIHCVSCCRCLRWC